MLNQKAQKSKGMVIAYWVMVAAAIALVVCIRPVMAAEETVWDRFSVIMKDFYGKLIGISTIVAVTMAAIALIIRMVSKNQKTVDEATAWIKRIIITWVLINSIGLIVAYIQPLIAGGNYGG